MANHVWPPNPNDPRIQNMLGVASARLATPDHVFVWFEAQGYSGTLDDMWDQHLTAKSITDTSEPFTTDLSLP